MWTYSQASRSSCTLRALGSNASSWSGESRSSSNTRSTLKTTTDR